MGETVVIDAVNAAIAQYEKAVYEIENTDFELYQYKKALNKKNMSKGLCVYFNEMNSDIQDAIFSLLDLPFDSHICQTPKTAEHKGQLIHSLQKRVFYMKKKLEQPS